MGPERFCFYGSVSEDSGSAFAKLILDLNVTLLDYLYGAFFSASVKTTDSDSICRVAL